MNCTTPPVVQDLGYSSNPRGFFDFYLLSGGLQAIRDLVAYLCEDIAIQ